MKNLKSCCLRAGQYHNMAVDLLQYRLVYFQTGFGIFTCSHLQSRQNGSWYTFCCTVDLRWLGSLCTSLRSILFSKVSPLVSHLVQAALLYYTVPRTIEFFVYSQIYSFFFFFFATTILQAYSFHESKENHWLKSRLWGQKHKRTHHNTKKLWLISTTAKLSPAYWQYKWCTFQFFLHFFS